MNYFREFCSRFAQILTYLPQYFPASGTVIIRNTSNVRWIILDFIFILDLILFTTELGFTYCKKERRILSIKSSFYPQSVFA